MSMTARQPSVRVVNDPTSHGTDGQPEVSDPPLGLPNEAASPYPVMSKIGGRRGSSAGASMPTANS